MRESAYSARRSACSVGAAQIDALRQDEEFVRNTADAMLIVDQVRHVAGYANEGVARQIEIYRDATAKVPQHS